MSRDERVAIPDGGTGSLTPPLSKGEDGAGAGSRRQAVESEASDTARHENQEFLLEVARRGPVLQALRSGPVGGNDLARTVELSRSTIHRAANSLQAHDLIEKRDGQYELTGLGRVVAEKVDTFGAEVGTARALEPFLNTVEMDDIPTEHFVDAKVTRPTPRQPHTSIQRIIELIERSDVLQMLSTVLSPLYVEVGYREMRDGMEIEAVFDRECIDIMVSQYAEQAHETVGTGNFTVYAHHGLPFELFILDDRIGMAAHDETGIARVLVECDAPAAVEWAEDLYAEHRSEAVSVMSDLQP